MSTEISSVILVFTVAQCLNAFAIIKSCRGIKILPDTNAALFIHKYGKDYTNGENNKIYVIIIFNFIFFHLILF